MTAINVKAKAELYLPQSNKSGTNINSMVFMVAIIIICVIALKRDLIPLKIHNAIIISETPISFVKTAAYSFPEIRETIC